MFSSTPSKTFLCRKLFLILCVLHDMQFVQSAHHQLQDGVVDEFICEACDSTEYCPGQNVAISCPTYSTSHTSATQLHDCICNGGKLKTCTTPFAQGTTNCVAGEFTCEAGVPPYYYIDGDQISCMLNRETIVSEALFISQCMCVIGHQPDSQPNDPTRACVACNSGTFKSFTNNNNCDPCPASSFHSIIGSTTIEDCDCNAGYEGDVNLVESTCTACQAGKYKDVRGDLAQDVQCEYCEDNFYPNALEAATACLPCRANSQVSTGLAINDESCQCNAGYQPVLVDSFPDYTQACESCAIGKYKTVVANIECDFCTIYNDASLNVNFYQDETGQSSCKACNVNTQEEPSGTQCLCNAGYYTNDIDTVSNPICIACDLNQYKPTSGFQACTDCPPNSLAASTASIARTDCLCNAGYVSDIDAVDDNYCIFCAAGKYKPTWGSDECSDCPIGKFMPEPMYALSCQDCLAGSYQDLEGQSSCALCPDYSTSAPGANSIDQCICNAGYVRELNSCEACEPGKYWHNAQCELCDYNQYQTREAATSCEDCGANSNSVPTLGTKCVCLAGYTCSTSDGSECINGDCIACDDDFYKDTQSYAPCTSCVPNSMTLHTFLDGRDHDEATDCKCVQGYKSDVIDGVPTCSACEAGKYSNEYLIANICPFGYQPTSDDTLCEKITTFTQSGSITFSSDVTCDILIVAGGGGGGSSGNKGAGGGGGAGGLLYLQNQTISADSYDITVGAGGAGKEQSASGSGENGENSLAFGFTAIGGGGGGGVPGYTAENAKSGGSGGGGGAHSSGGNGPAGAGTEGQGNNGANGHSSNKNAGGGGGSEAAPNPFDDGGNGKTIDISGTARSYAGGGGGGSGWSNGNQGIGQAGGGNGGYNGGRHGQNAAANTGSGGGGAGSSGTQRGNGGNGGSGIVIIREITAKLFFNAQICTNCPTITYTPVHPAHDISQCSTCTMCAINFYWIHGCGLPVVDGEADFSIDMVCQECGLSAESPVNSVTESLPTADNNYNQFPTSCVCRPGQFLNAGTCDFCEIGFYQDNYNLNTNCLSCQHASTTLQTGADSIGDCTCNVGYVYTTGDVCQACAPGTFKNTVSNADPCQTCPDASGTWGADAEFSAGIQIELSAQSVCLCDSGYELEVGTTVCSACVPGKFKFLGENSRCLDCSAGKYSKDSAQSMCLACQVNSDSSAGASQCACNSGFQQTDGSGNYNAQGFFCQQCVNVVGQELTNLFKTGHNTLPCTECSTSCGIIDEIPHRISTQCTYMSDIVCVKCSSCTVGQYAETECAWNSVLNVHDTLCAPCSIGYYCPNEPNYFQTDQKRCPGGATSELGSVEVGACGCAPGRYLQGYGAVGDLEYPGYQADQITCTDCLVNHWCVQEQLFRCPQNSHLNTDPTQFLLSDYSNSLNCHCDPGYYRTVSFPTEDCLRDDPDISVPCEYGHIFCLECHDGSGDDDADPDRPDGYYCNDNTRFECPPNSHTGNSASASQSVDDCQCTAGYYKPDSQTGCIQCPVDFYCPAISDDSVACQSVGNNRYTNGARGRLIAEQCVCKPGFYSANKMTVEDGKPYFLDHCRACPVNAICPGNGDDQFYLCPANSLLANVVDANRDAKNCICNAGYGCEDDNCPGASGSIFMGACTQCTAVGSTVHEQRESGSFKTSPGNFACTPCQACPEILNFITSQCTSTCDRQCGLCSGCAPDNYMETVCSVTDPFQAMVCLPCDTCSEFNRPLIEFECRQANDITQNRQCREINIDLCNVGYYRKVNAPDSDGFYRQDSTCEACELPLSVDYPLPGHNLHEFVGGGRILNDESSCAFECKFGTIVRDTANILQGCRTCEIGNFLYKIAKVGIMGSVQDIDQSLIQMPVDCDFECVSGSEPTVDGSDCRAPGHRTDFGFDGYMRVPAGGIQYRTADASGSNTINGWQFVLHHSFHTPFVISMGQNAPTCSPHQISCCLLPESDIILVDYRDFAASPTNMNLPGTVNCIQAARDNTQDFHIQKAFVNSEAVTQITISDQQLYNYANCAIQESNVHCTLILTYIDIILHRQIIMQIDLERRESSHVVLWNHHVQHYTPLNFFKIHTRFLYFFEQATQTLAVYEIELELQSIHTQNLKAVLELHTAPDSTHYTLPANFVDVTQAQEHCMRYVLQDTHGHYDSIVTLNSATRSRWRTRWAVPRNTDSIRIRVNFKLDTNNLWLSSLDILRNVQAYKPMCFDPVTAQSFKLNYPARIMIGFENHMQTFNLSSQQIPEPLVSSGVSGQLCTLIFGRSAELNVVISRMVIFVAHIRGLQQIQYDEFAAQANITQRPALQAFEVELPTAPYDFSDATKNLCRDFGEDKCLLEVIHLHDAHVKIINTCSSSERSTGTEWLHIHFGQVSNLMNVVCKEHLAMQQNALTVMMKLRANAGMNWNSYVQTQAISTFLWVGNNVHITNTA